MYIPNSWNFLEYKLCKLSKECIKYMKFWNKKRLSRAKEINLTPIEVSILAS